MRDLEAMEFRVDDRVAEWYQGVDGWEYGHEALNLHRGSDFIAFRRKVTAGRILYEGYFWDAMTGKKQDAYLDVIVTVRGRKYKPQQDSQ